MNQKRTCSENIYIYTVNGHKYSLLSILRYIFHIKPHFPKKYCDVISKRILIIFAPEEAEILRFFYYFSMIFRWIAFIF
jgi:hypothetical protein